MSRSEGRRRTSRPRLGNAPHAGTKLAWPGTPRLANSRIAEARSAKRLVAHFVSIGIAHLRLARERTEHPVANLTPHASELPPAWHASLGTGQLPSVCGCRATPAAEAQLSSCLRAATGDRVCTPQLWSSIHGDASARGQQVWWDVRLGASRSVHTSARSWDRCSPPIGSPHFIHR